jgi:hypothetical protein
MRRLLPLLLLAVAAVGCDGKNPLSPTGAGGTAPQPFVLRSMNDPRLPAPMLEATGASAADWAGLRRPVTDARGDRTAGRATDPATFWNQSTIDLATRAGLSAPLFARATALTQNAIYDALIAAQDPRRGQLPEPAVAAGAASVVLTHLFPGESGRVNAWANAQAGFKVAHTTTGARARAWSLGRRVGRLVVERARTDGSRATFQGTIPGGERWSGQRPVLPMGGGWRCWILTGGDAVRPEAPYAIGSAEDRDDLEEVVRISLGRTPEQIAAVEKWSESPIAVWNRILAERLAGRGATAIVSARAFAYLNVALHDGLVASWRAKYTYWTAGPDQRHPGLAFLAAPPNAPSYVSGDAAAAGAASAVLGELFPREAASFSRQADEAALSGLWAGSCFRHDVEQGLAVGRGVGERAVHRMRGDGPMGLLAGR